MRSFDREFGFECEFCGDTLGGGLLDFYESVEEKKNNGWLSRTIEGDWYDFCSDDCYKEYLDLIKKEKQ